MTDDPGAEAVPGEQTCPACGEPNPARARFCLACGVRLADEAGERRVVTVVFADLSGFTSFSERTDPEEVRALADEAASGLSEIVLRYGGAVDKIIGDCVMAVFGAPVSHEDDVERALRSSLEMLTYVNDRRDRFAGMPLRIGVNTGEAMFAPVGPHGEYTVIGDTVNTCSRLQGAAPRGGILVGEATYRATADLFEFEDLDPIEAKGKENPVLAWRVVAARDTVHRRVPSRIPLVGRRLELDRLLEMFEHARTERSPQFVSILGAPGIGKSRLIDALTERVGGAASVYVGRCLSYGEGITYWPVVEIIKAAAGIMRDDDLDTVSEKLGAFLEGLGTDDLDELRTMAVAMANLVAVPRTPRGTYSASEISKGELHWGVRRMFELHAAKRPVVLVVEDLHWAEPTLLELLEYIVETRPSAPILAIGSARPELKDAAPPLLDPKINRRSIGLEALDDGDSRAMLAELVGAEAGSGPLADALRAAAGNPLFLEETVRMLVEAGALDEKGRVVGAAGVLVPGSLQYLINARLDALPVLEKRVAGYAAVVGSVFWEGALSHLDGAVGDLEQGLDGLEARDIVRENESSSLAGERELVFKHALFRDVAYARLPKAQRAELHDRCADWIAKLATGEDEYVEFVAYHLEQACVLAAEVERAAQAPPILAAVRALKRAGEKAEAREGTREAERYYSRALDLVGDRLPETTTELRFQRSAALATLGDLDTAVQQLEEITEAAIGIGRDDLRCRSMLELANIEQANGLVSEAREHLARALAIARAAGDRLLEARAALVNGSFRADFLGELPDAIADLRAALALAEELESTNVRIEGHLRLGTLLFNAGDLEGAEENFLACATLAGREGSLRHEATATAFLGAVKYYRGPREDSERLSLQALSWLERTADRYIQTQTLQRLALLAAGRGECVAAEERLREALPLAQRISPWLVAELNRRLAEVFAQVGRVSESRKAAAAARDAAPPADAYAWASVLLAEGAVAAAEGDADTVRARFREAIECLDGLSMRLESAEARIAFARALARVGDPGDAGEHLAAARETALDMRAHAMLDEIDAFAAAS